MTLDEIESALTNRTYKDKDGTQIAVFRPLGQYSFIEIKLSLLQAALLEIKNKIPIVQYELDTFTACEVLVLITMQAHAEQGY